MERRIRFTTPAVRIAIAQCETDIRLGLTPLREPWILARDDTLELEQPSSIYRRGREAMSELDGDAFHRGAPAAAG